MMLSDKEPEIDCISVTISVNESRAAGSTFERISSMRSLSTRTAASLADS